MDSDVNQRRLVWLGRLFHAGGFASLVLGVCLYNFAVTRLFTRHQRDNAEQTAQLETLLEKGADMRRQHQRLARRLGELEQRAETVRQRIPDQPQEAAFLEQITAAAKSRGLTIQNYQRGGVAVTDTHSELEIRLIGLGDYQSICGFFEEIGALPRIVIVRRMTVSAPRGSGQYPLDMTLKLFFAARIPGAQEMGPGG